MSSFLPSLRFLVLDTETTGFVPKTHHVIEYACEVIENGVVTDAIDELLALPEGETIPQTIAQLTQIFPDDLKGKPIFADILPRLSSLVTEDTILVGQNIPFDLGMLAGEGWDLRNHPWIDTSMLASIVFPELESYSLGYLSEVLHLNHTPKHRALGDVRATAELLEKITIRLQELPKDDLQKMVDIAQKSSQGYARFFASLQSTNTSSVRPAWLSIASRTLQTSVEALPLSAPPVGTVQLLCDELPPRTEAILSSLKNNEWFAVKNMHSTLSRVTPPTNVTLLSNPEHLLSRTKCDALLALATITVDEMTLLQKIALYDGKCYRDFPIHGGEKNVWYGKLACTKNDKEYRDLLETAMHTPTLLTHAHLLRLIGDTPEILRSDTHIIVDDASMLEDTATEAYGFFFVCATVRAAAEGNERAMRLLDSIELWALQTRNGMDLRYLTDADLSLDSTLSFKKNLEECLLLRDAFPPSFLSSLSTLLSILDPLRLDTSIVWIEAFQDGSQSIKAVPSSIATLLSNTLFQKHRVSLIVPPESFDRLQAILHDDIPVQHHAEYTPSPLTLQTKNVPSLEALLKNPPDGKSILLVASKRSIEDIYVRYYDLFSAQNATLLCQGFAGGTGRMQAEFLMAQGTSVMVMTPWMYEGLDLPPHTVAHLFIQTLPFDHPSHAVISKRALRFLDAFTDYSLPRLTQRLFRLLRTFSLHATQNGTISLLDDRLEKKEYGKKLRTYLESLFEKKSEKKEGVEQMRLF